MAITRSNKGSVATTDIKAATQPNGKVPESTPESPKKSSLENRKEGFFRSAITEVRKAEWPTFGYVVRWSLVIILFTAVLSSLLGFVDFTFENLLDFVDCTSPQSRGEELQACGQELFENMTYQNLST
jgi:preprotein translocase SecE subunit